jgi:hypothetical protein
MMPEKMLDELTVTSEMIAAGVFEAREHPLGAPLAELVTKVYLAMATEADVSNKLSSTIEDASQ